MKKAYVIFEIVQFDLEGTGDDNGLALVNADEYSYTSEKKAEEQIEKYLEFGDKNKMYIAKTVYSK
tara:strand:+ start:466 stop:663 length:198 start_codon:yes stop_codon:yes gene_type:complete